jgi:hypothetical protein
MAGKSQPLSQQFPIVGADGRPTEYFIRWAQARQLDISKGVTAEQVEQAIADWAALRSIIAGNGLSGGGTLGSDRTLTLDASLDDLNDVDFSTPPEPGDTLVFDDETGMFKPGQSAGGGNVEPTEVGPSGYYAAGSQPRKIWQLNILSNKSGNPNTSIMLAEIQFRTTPGVPQLVGPGVASASSVLGDGFASKAFDNNAGTFWHTAGTSASTIQYNYDDPITVQEVMIKLRDGGDSVGGSPEVFEVRCSDDGLVWETMWLVADAEWTTNAQTKVFTNPNIGAMTNYYPVMLSALNNVADEQPEDGEALVWSDALGMWVPGPGGGGGGGGLPSGAAPGNVIEYQTDAPAWVDPANGLGGNPGVSQPYGKHAYWSLQSTQQGDGRYALVAELIFRATPGGPRIPSVGTAIQGGNYGGNVAALAFDGNGESVWESQNQDNTGPGTLWVGFHYDEPVSVTQVAIQVHPSYETDERPLAGNIRYSDDGITWTTAWSFAGLTYPTITEVVTSPAYVPPSNKYYLLPSGGDTGQVPVKASAADGHFAWADQTGGGGGGGGGGSGSWVPPLVQVSRVADLPVAHNTWTPVPFDTEIRDDLSAWSAAEPTKIFVPPNVTRARLTAFMVWQGNGSANRYLGFAKNSQLQGDTFVQVSNGNAWQTGDTAISSWVDCVPGDYFTVVVAQESGGTLSLRGLEGGLPNQHSNLQIEFDDGTAGGGGGGSAVSPSIKQKASLRNDGNLTLPAMATAGNMLVFVVGGFGGGLYVPPGFGLVSSFQGDSNNIVRCYAKRAVGDETTWALSATDNQFCVIYEAENCASVTSYKGGALEPGNGNPYSIGLDQSPVPASSLTVFAAENDNDGVVTVQAAENQIIDLITNDGGNHRGAILHTTAEYQGNVVGSFPVYQGAVYGAWYINGPKSIGGGGSGGGDPVPWWTGGVSGIPKASDFTVVKNINDFAVTLHDEDDGLHMEVGVGGNPASDRTALLERPIASLTFDFSALIVGQNIQRQFQNIGVYCRNSGSGRMVTCGLGWAETRGWTCLRWNSVGNFNGSYTETGRPVPDWPLWMRISGDGTTMFFWIGRNNKYWTLIQSVPFADFVGAADRIGVHYVASQVQPPQNVVENLHLMGFKHT